MDYFGGEGQREGCATGFLLAGLLWVVIFFTAAVVVNQCVR